MPAVSGVDWASQWHDVCVSDHAGTMLAEQRFTHDELGLQALIGLLPAHQVSLVAIERPDGLLVGRLLAAGLHVLAIHPNQVAAARDRFRAAAGKDDRWPGARRIFADVDSAIGLAFLARYPAQADTRNLGPKRLEGFLARHGYAGRRTPQQLLERLHTAPIAVLGELEAEAHRAAVLGLVAALTPIVEQLRQLTSQIRGAVHKHPDGPIFTSFFKDPKSVVCAAGLLAEIGDNRARYPTPAALAADAGQAPVAKESGTRRHATFRWACDKRLRSHFGVLSDSTRHWHPWAGDIDTRATDRGCQHAHANRVLGRAWTRVLWRCWHDHQPYDPTQHGNHIKRLNARG